MSTSTTYKVVGMTCGHCSDAVSTELGLLPGVRGVQVDLVADGVSAVTVVSDIPLERTAVADALDEAGDYTLQAGDR